MCRWHSGVRRALSLLGVSTVLVLTPAVVYALNLGKLYVYSHLHAPLSAEIELISSSPDELNTLIAKVAAPWNSTAVSAESRRFLSNVRATVVKRSDQRYFLELRSEEPLSEPFLQFVLDVKWAKGSLLYEFTALIDPLAPTDNAEEKAPTASAKVTELSAVPRLAAASSQHPSATVPEPVPIPAPSVAIAQRGQTPVEPQTITGASLVASSDKRDLPASSTASNHVLASVGETAAGVEPGRTKPESPTPARKQTNAEPGALRSPASRSASPAAARVTTSDTQPSISRVPAAKQSALSAATELITKHPTWALTIVVGLVAALTLLVVGLVVVIVKRQPRDVKLGPESSVPAPKFVTPPNADRDETGTESDRRWQDRRRNEDRRQRSVPVANERRTGLARRRSELIHGGHATVSVEELDPIVEAEAYLAGGCYRHAEGALKEAITKNPSRLDLKIKLLEVYEQSGNQTAFSALADELRPALDEAGEESQCEVRAEVNDLAGGKTLSSDHSLLDDATASITPAPATAQQKKMDSGPRPAVGAEADEGLIEWEPLEMPTGTAKAMIPTATQGGEQIDAPQQRSAAATGTLEQAFTDFLQARKTLKRRTIEGYKRIMATVFLDWHDKPLLEISAEMIAQRHQELSEDRSAAYADRAMRFLRTLYNFALPRYHTGSDSAVPENPVRCLQQDRSR